MFSMTLLIACWNGNLDKVKELVANGQIDPNTPDAEGNTLLYFAARDGAFNVVKWLVSECKVDCNPRNNVGETVFDVIKRREVAEWLAFNCSVDRPE